MPVNGPIVTDEAGEPERFPRGGSPGSGSGRPGGGPPNPGPGSSFPGVGSNFLGFGAGASSFNGFGPRRKYYTMADQTVQMPGATSTSGVNFAQGGPVSGGPPGTDTVNAHLNNGEYVVNAGAASDPNNAMELERMNGGPGGGHGSSQMDAGMGPGLSRQALVELLHVLLGDEQSFCYGGRMNYSLGGWVGKHAWILPLVAAAAPLALGALGAASGSVAAGGATAAGAGGAGTVAVPAAIHTGLGAAFAAHPALATILNSIENPGTLTRLGMAAGSAAQDQESHRMDARAANAADSDQTLAMWRASQAPGMALGGWWNRGGQPGWAGGKPGGQPSVGTPLPGGPPQPGPQPGGPGVAPQTPVAPAYNTAGGAWAQPNLLSSMQEAGSRDANNYASGVYRNAQLMGADPGAAASYKLSALASAGRGSADALSQYRTNYATSEADRLFQLEKMRQDEYYQEKLKRIGR